MSKLSNAVRASVVLAMALASPFALAASNPLDMVGISINPAQMALLLLASVSVVPMVSTIFSPLSPTITSWVHRRRGQPVDPITTSICAAPISSL